MADHAAPQPNTDVAASMVLLAATAAALIAANTGLAGLYKAFLGYQIGFDIGVFALTGTTKTWIKDALMAIFFLLVGLEIKAEFKEGALADRKRAVLPFAAAAGGMAVPAIVYLAVTAGQAGLARGWAIPSATDIAFAVGVVGLLGAKVVPAGLKAFLLAVAVIDDLGAILVIALFYTGELGTTALLVSAAMIAALVIMNRAGVDRLWPYLLVGLALWLAMSKSGISPTLAGVIAAITVPLKAKDGVTSPLHDLAHALKIPVLFVIMPVFAFANAGVPLFGLGLSDLLAPVTLGIALGLFIGKPIGIGLATYLAVKSGAGRLPDGTDWLKVIGVACIAGIGFTMSLFIGALAFPEAMQDQVRLGVLVGSLLSTIAGVLILLMAARAAPVAARVPKQAP